ncbi:MAG: hypothetical protein WBA74_24325, partial [Cyclobacteriaceae bacterium]
MKKISLFLSIALLGAMFSACSTSDKKNGTPEASPQQAPNLKVYVFTVGDILVKDISLFNKGVDEGQQMKFTNSAYLIRHPKGDLLWDTGLADQLSEKPEGNDSEAFLMKMPKTLKSQLDE